MRLNLIVDVMHSERQFIVHSYNPFFVCVTAPASSAKMEAATPYKAVKKGSKDLERGKTPAKSATLDDFSPEGAADEFDVALVSESRYNPIPRSFIIHLAYSACTHH